MPRAPRAWPSPGWRERGQERQELAAAQLLAKDHRARAVGSVQLKDVLGEIQSDGAHLVHGRLLEGPATPSLWHTTAAGGVHPITAILNNWGERRTPALSSAALTGSSPPCTVTAARRGCSPTPSGTSARWLAATNPGCSLVTRCSAWRAPTTASSICSARSALPRAPGQRAHG